MPRPNDPKKYDSPLMFWHDGEAYLVARRNVTETGAYDLGYRHLDRTAQTVQYQLAYGNTPKRCALWRGVQGEDRVDGPDVSWRVGQRGEARIYRHAPRFARR